MGNCIKCLWKLRYITSAEDFAWSDQSFNNMVLHCLWGSGCGHWWNVDDITSYHLHHLHQWRCGEMWMIIFIACMGMWWNIGTLMTRRVPIMLEILPIILFFYHYHRGKGGSSPHPPTPPKWTRLSHWLMPTFLCSITMALVFWCSTAR